MTFTLSQALGYEQAMRFLLESKTVDAEEALRLGLVGEVVDDDKWDARLREYCQNLCAIVSPITMRMTKRTLVKATTAIDLEAQTRLELVSIGKAFASQDAKEARQAFLEKRIADVRREVDPTGGASVFTQPWRLLRKAVVLNTLRDGAGPARYGGGSPSRLGLLQVLDGGVLMVDGTHTPSGNYPAHARAQVIDLETAADRLVAKAARDETANRESRT